MRRFAAIALVVTGVIGWAGVADGAASAGSVRVTPRTIDFGAKVVGGTYYDQVRITNVSGVALNVLVEAGLPDDFGFGFMPGSTCPVLVPGAVMAAKESCVAVVRFSPTDYFAGREQYGSLTVRTTDPATGAVTMTTVPVSGTGRA